MDENPQGGSPSEGGNKRNRRRKKNKNQSGLDANNEARESKRGAQLGDAEQTFNKPKASTLIQGNGKTGKFALLPRPAIQEQGQQLLVHVDRENRNVQQVKQRSTESDANSNSNANNARYRDKGKGKVFKNSNKQNKEKEQGKESQVSHKGCFVKLEGKELLINLAEHRIFELKKKNPSFPNAKYFCRLCEYHLDRPQDCERHVDENRHQRKKEAMDMEGILENIPQPSRQQVRALDSIVESITQQEGLSPAQLESRHDVVHRLQTFVKKFRGDIQLQMYGSSLTGVGQKGSDINLDVSGPGPTPALLLAVFRLLQQNGAPAFVDTHSNFNAKIPVVEVTDSQTGCQIVLTINGQAAVLTSSLLQLYVMADPRVKQLAITLRTWARICHLDRQEEGMLPAFAFNIMVVYFLQQVQPPVLCLLPLLQNPPEGKGLPPLKMEDKLDVEALKAQAEAWQSENKSSVGELWLELLRFYCLEFDNTQFVISLLQSQPLTRQEKKWNSKKLAIEDPFNPKKNIANSLANSLIFEYYQSCVRKAYEYFGMPRDKDGTVNVCLESLRALASRKTETLLKENQQDPAASASSSSVDASDKDSPQKEMVVRKVEESTEEGEESIDEESMVEKANDDQSVVIQSNKSIMQKLAAVAGQKKTADKTASTEDSALLSPGVSTVSSCNRSAPAEGRAVTESFNESSFGEDLADSSGLCSSEPRTDSDVGALSVSDLDDLSVLSSDVAADSAAGTSVLSAQDVSAVSREYFSAIDHMGGESSDEYETSPETPEEVTADAVPTLSKEMDQLNMSEKDTPLKGAVGEREAGSASAIDDDESSMVDWYTFTEQVFTGGKGPAVICGYCEQEGHIKGNCPEDKLPSLVPLPPMNPEHLNLLENVIHQIIFDFAPTDANVRKRHRLVKELEVFVQQIYPDAEFALFGSSCNGFGFHRSDLDICMTFKGKTVEDVDVVDVIEKVAKKLNEKARLYYNVVCIPTAKVPIVKFVEGETRLEGDISLYNTLAQCNTRLLWCYSEIDKRVKILGYTVKIFAKICDIGDASRGSLSSYGYILMMLHYLQQCRPPIIPVLQELHPEGKCPERMVEGCNTWFFDDLRHLPQVWRDCGKNRQGLAELWLGFLRYYLERFDWKTMVVTIRQTAPLSKFEKMWNGNTIAVEDPFDLSHNLGGGLSRKMNNYIYKTFVKGRQHFGTPFQYQKDLVRRHKNPSEYFFDSHLLMDGKPPNDRGCRMCGKIGHMVKDCPNRSHNRKRQQNQTNQETRETSSQQDNQQSRKKSSKEAKGQTNAETRGQSNTQVKEGKGQSSKDKEVKEHVSSQVRGQKEGNDSKTMSSEKQSDVHPDQDKGKNQSSKPSQKQAASRPDSGPKPSEEKKSAKKKEKARQAASEFQAAVTSAGHSRAPTTSTSITTTAASMLATVTTSSTNIPRTPPACSSTPHRQPSRPETSDTLPSPGLVSSDALPRSLTSTPAHSASPALHPPGVQMNVQQLFTMAQRSGGQPATLVPQEVQKQASLAPGLHPSQLTLTPEQQIALLDTHGTVKGRQSTSGASEAGSSGYASRGTPDSQMTPVSVTALFQAQTPASPAQPPHSPQHMMPLPLKSLLPAHPPSPQQVSGSYSLSQTPPSGSGMSFMSMSSSPGQNVPAAGPQQMTPLPMKNLFPSYPPSQRESVSYSASGTPPSGPGPMASSMMNPSQSVAGTSSQQMTPLPLKTLFSSQPVRPTGGSKHVDPRLPNPPKQPISLRFLLQGPSQQQQQQVMQNPAQYQPAQQQQMMLQQQAQLQQAQQQFMQNVMHKLQEQKQAVGSSSTQSLASAAQHSAHSSVTPHPPGFQPFPAHPHTMTQLASSHGQPPDGQQLQGHPDRPQHLNSPERGRGPHQPSGFPPTHHPVSNEVQMSAPHLQPTPFQQHTSVQNPVSAFMQMMSSQSQPTAAVPASAVLPAVHSHPMSGHESQPLSSSPLCSQPPQLASLQQGTLSRQPPHASLPLQQGHPEGEALFMQSAYSQPMAMLPQQNPPMMSQSGGDRATLPPNWSPSVQPVDTSMDPFFLQQQLILQQQQYFTAAQGMVGYPQTVPGQAAPVMGPYGPSQMGHGVQTTKTERHGSSSSQDTTG